MSTVKISELVQLPNLGANTSATDILAVDRANNITGRVTATTLSRYLYANNVLNVGNNALVLPNVAAQFAGRSNNYLQMNFVNNASNGSTDFVITADVGTDESHYLDLGYNNSNYNYDGFTFAAPLDGYLMIAGNDADPGGNLIIGTYNENRDLTISLGSIASDGHFARFKYNTGLQLLTKPLFFADGTSQNTAAEPANYTQAAFLKANTVNTYAYAANTWAQANVGAALAAAKVYSDTYTMVASNAFTTAANTWLQANDATTLTAAKSYADGLNAAQLNTAFSYTDSAFLKANVALDFANGAFSKANTTATNLVITNSLASGAYTLAVAANTTGSAAFDKANNALANATGTFAGSLSVTNNLNVNGISSFANSSFSSSQALVTISASNTGITQTPGGDGYVLHITGKHNVPTRVISDSYGANGQIVFPIFGGRAARGNVSHPSAVQTNDVLTRIGASGYGATAWQSGGTSRIDFIATENYTDTARGSAIKFYNIETGSNTLINIATFNANNVSFTGYVNPSKGVVYSPRLPVGLQTSITIDYVTDSVIKANCADNISITHSNYVAGKIVEVWLVNTDTQNHTVTHGCSVLNSTNKSTTATITAGSSMYLRFFSIDGDNANTFVSING
jgi:hypothetical protein